MIVVTVEINRDVVSAQEGAARPFAGLRGAELAQALPLAVVAEPLLLAAPARVRLARPESARGPPVHHGPPLFVRNCSFLI